MIDLSSPPWRALTDELIALVYLLIPAALFSSASSRKHIMGRGFRDPATMILILFGLFIMACGVGHQIDAWFIFRGECAGFTDIKTRWNWVTATLSVGTLVVLWRIVPTYIALLFKPVDLERIRHDIEEIKDIQDHLDGQR